MRTATYLLVVIATCTFLAGPARASQDSIPSVIESFIEHQFPKAQSHFWVVNSTEWGSKDEVVVDLNTVVQVGGAPSRTEQRFLLLIVAGKLAAAQSVPLGAKVECEPDDIV